MTNLWLLLLLFLVVVVVVVVLIMSRAYYYFENTEMWKAWLFIFADRKRSNYRRFRQLYKNAASIMQCDDIYFYWNLRIAFYFSGLYYDVSRDYKPGYECSIVIQKKDNGEGFLKILSFKLFYLKHSVTTDLSNRQNFKMAKFCQPIN